MNQQEKKREKKLLGFFRELTEAEQDTIVEFSEFIFEKNKDQRITIPQEPLSIERPETETVIQAVKRLKRTYPMIDSVSVLEKVSHFITQHLMQGRDKTEVIDDLEKYFLEKYREFKESNKKENIEP